MASDTDKALVRRMYEEGGKGDLAAIDEVVAPGFVFHNPADPAMGRGPEGIKRMMSRWRAAFPDGEERVEAQVAEGNKVVSRWSFRGTHRGELFGIAPTGKQVTFTGIAIDEVEGGKIVGHWDEADILGLLQQLGAVPALGQAGRPAA